MQTRKRLPNIKAGLLKGLNYTQIGEKCGVQEKTIDRDIAKWLESGDFETWIKAEWMWCKPTGRRKLRFVYWNKSPHKV